MPQLIQYAGYIPYNQSQTSVIFSWILSGFFVQFYLIFNQLTRSFLVLVSVAVDLQQKHGEMKSDEPALPLLSAGHSCRQTLWTSAKVTALLDLEYQQLWFTY